MRKFAVIPVAPELRRIGARVEPVGATLAQPREPFFWLGAEAEKPPGNQGLG